jgi:hypothetical protein
MLFPAAVLVMVVLAAMAVDLSIGFMSQRELREAVAGAANDAAALALDERAFYEDGRVELDGSRLERLAHDRVAQTLDSRRHQSLEVIARATAPERAGCPWTVAVSARSRVSLLFAAALPGGPEQLDLRAEARSIPAGARRDPLC